MAHRVGGMAVAVVLSTSGVLGMLGGAAAQDGAPTPAPQVGATTPDAGWWNRARPMVALPTGPLPTVPNPGVPAGSLVVSAGSGDPTAVTAVGIDRKGLDGETITVATLTMREVTDGGANLNGAFAAIVACPITEFWFGGENGEWDGRPKADCDLGRAEGTRGADGAWTFDLTSIMQAWSDGDLDPNGVLLVEAVEPPTSFRTVFAGVAAQAIGITVEATGGTPTTARPTPTTVPAGGTASGGTGSGTSSGGGTRGSIGSAAPVAPAAPAAPAPVTPPADVGATPVLAELPGPLESLPLSTIGLVLLVVGVALAAMIALGPNALPVAAGRTGRGVSRALARKEPT